MKTTTLLFLLILLSEQAYCDDQKAIKPLSSKYFVTKEFNPSCDADPIEHYQKPFSNLEISDRYKIVAKTSGDLNHDGIKDYVAVLEQTRSNLNQNSTKADWEQCPEDAMMHSYVFVSALSSRKNEYKVIINKSFLKDSDYIEVGSLSAQKDGFKLTVAVGQSGDGLGELSFKVSNQEIYLHKKSYQVSKPDEEYPKIFRRVYKKESKSNISNLDIQNIGF